MSCDLYYIQSFQIYSRDSYYTKCDVEVTVTFKSILEILPPRRRYSRHLRGFQIYSRDSRGIAVFVDQNGIPFKSILEIQVQGDLQSLRTSEQVGVQAQEVFQIYSRDSHVGLSSSPHASGLSLLSNLFQRFSRTRVLPLGGRRKTFKSILEIREGSAFFPAEDDNATFKSILEIRRTMMIGALDVR